MKLYTLEKEQVIDKPLEHVFAFFEKPENLARITPPGMRFNILTPSPISMRTGTIIDYTIRILGFGIRWRSIITDYDPPHGFIDEQLKGPYGYWHHRHRFEKTGNGTRIYDKVTYGLPFGYVGGLAHSLFVKRQLEHIFDFRSSVISEVFTG